MDFVQKSCQKLTTKGGVKTSVKSLRDITVALRAASLCQCEADHSFKLLKIYQDSF